MITDSMVFFKAFPKAFDNIQITKIVHKDNEVMILQLKQDLNGPLWRQKQWPRRGRSSRMVRPATREGTRPKGRLMVAGIVNKKEGLSITQGSVVVGQLQVRGPWIAEGPFDEVCPWHPCFVVLWQKLYGLHRTYR